MGMKKVRLRKKRNKVIDFTKEMRKRISDNDVTGFAAQLSYFFLLSLFPMLIFLFTLLPYTPLTQEDIFHLIKDFAPEETYTMIKRTISGIMDNRSSGLLSVGFIATLWAASKGMNALMKSLNRAYDVEEKRSFIVSRGLSIVLTIAMIFVFMLALLLPVFGKQLGLFIFSYLGLSDQFLKIWGAIRWILSPVILFLVFLAVYYLAPNIRIRCVTAIPGSIFASLGWIVVSLGFSFYVSNFGNYTAMYGSIGTIIIMMLWFYFSAIIIMVGGEINSYFSDKQGKCD
ncbi:YihY/virulence factor BrkB family protein [Siminovitchia acidinfaciens]|uniref:YihY/virulence factor BrkB family protein n=2 Tax=Siminovitchia acidinfaciens TaxID=2321395 RepID=A0A429XVL6_9BACI|nr:YihY/virulence factor BrkB family protein [Siminovitchia acidinfaciens]